MLSLYSHLILLVCLVATTCGQSMSDASTQATSAQSVSDTSTQSMSDTGTSTSTSTTTTEFFVTATLSWNSSASGSATATGSASANSSSSNATASQSGSPNATTTGKYPFTTDNSCGPEAGFMCLTDGVNPCCSGNGYCGGTDQYCAPSSCQSDYGLCTPPNTTLGYPACSWAGAIGTSPRCDGRCGSEFGDAVCNPDAGANDYAQYGVFEYGPCCSVEGFCGNSTAHCGARCQSGCNGSDSVFATGGATVTVTASAAATSATGAAVGRVEVGGWAALGLAVVGAVVVG